MRFSSLITYTFNEDIAMRQAGAGIITLVLFFDFLGGFFSGILEWTWIFLAVALWSFFYSRHFLGEAVKIKTYDEILRDVVSFGIMLLFLLIFWAGYLAGPRNWWWLCLPLVFFHIGVSRIIQKPHK